jgi:kynurenine--oxoglutarate transaminase/cysteine-S-conjugate beta-lyase/glutamine--phenylpyruvate transaminase
MEKSLKSLKSSLLSIRSVSTAKRLRGFDAPTVWSEFTPLSIKHKSVNLGQGFPDWESPAFVKDALSKSVQANFNQYCRSGGEISLVTALAKHYSPLVNRTIDPLNEVTTSVGATEAIFAIMQSLINEGDEVVVLEPAFDIYPAQVQMSGGVCKYVKLEYDNNSSKWTLDMNKLESSITSKTKIVLINSPHNPCGKVFTQSELEDLAAIVRRNPHIIVVMDEVYEKLIYDNKKHVRFASLPDMWDRTITVSSCGKTFSCTGWKVGWVFGSADLVKPIMLANQWVQFCVSTPTQQAVAQIIEQSSKPYEGFPSYYDWVCKQYEKKRDHLTASLKLGHLDPIIPEGGFFIIANTSKHNVPQKYILEPGPTGESPVTRDWGFARWLTTEVGVTPIPPSAFYIDSSKHHAKDYARFAFCKTDESLVEARVRLDALGKKM